jgi:hypothetical protein
MFVYAAGRHGWLGIVTALADENILDHQRVDGWTRWVACAYSGAAKRQTLNSKA